MNVLLIVCSKEGFFLKREFYEQYITENIKRCWYSYLFQVVYDETDKIKFFRWIKLGEDCWEQRFWSEGFNIELLNYSFDKEFMDRLLFIKPLQVDCFAIIKDKFIENIQTMIHKKGMRFKLLI